MEGSSIRRKSRTWEDPSPKYEGKKKKFGAFRGLRAFFKRKSRSSNEPQDAEEGKTRSASELGQPTVSPHNSTLYGGNCMPMRTKKRKNKKDTTKEKSKKEKIKGKSKKEKTKEKTKKEKKTGKKKGKIKSSKKSSSVRKSGSVLRRLPPPPPSALLKPTRNSKKSDRVGLVKEIETQEILPVHHNASFLKVSLKRQPEKDQSKGDSGLLYVGAAGLSVSHDSVFNPDQSGINIQGSASSLHLRAELEARLRRRSGSPGDSTEDLGLPHSPSNHTDILKESLGHGDGSLLSMASSENDEDSGFGHAGSRHSSRVSLHDRRSTDSDVDAEEGLHHLNHAAARHKMQIRPQRNHRARRPRRLQQLSGTSLPTTPEVNEESVRSLTPESSPTTDETVHESVPSLQTTKGNRKLQHEVKQYQEKKRNPSDKKLKAHNSKKDDKKTKETAPEKEVKKEEESSFFSRIFGSMRSGGKKKDEKKSEDHETKMENTDSPALRRGGSNAKEMAKHSKQNNKLVGSPIVGNKLVKSGSLEKSQTSSSISEYKNVISDFEEKIWRNNELNKHEDKQVKKTSLEWKKKTSKHEESEFLTLEENSKQEESKVMLSEHVKVPSQEQSKTERKTSFPYQPDHGKQDMSALAKEFSSRKEEKSLGGKSPDGSSSETEKSVTQRRIYQRRSANLESSEIAVNLRKSEDSLNKSTDSTTVTRESLTKSSDSIAFSSESLKSISSLNKSFTSLSKSSDSLSSKGEAPKKDGDDGKGNFYGVQLRSTGLLKNEKSPSATGPMSLDSSLGNYDSKDLSDKMKRATSAEVMDVPYAKKRYSVGGRAALRQRSPPLNHEDGRDSSSHQPLLKSKSSHDVTCLPDSYDEVRQRFPNHEPSDPLMEMAIRPLRKSSSPASMRPFSDVVPATIYSDTKDSQSLKPTSLNIVPTPSKPETKSPNEPITPRSKTPSRFFEGPIPYGIRTPDTPLDFRKVSLNKVEEKSSTNLLFESTPTKFNSESPTIVDKRNESPIEYNEKTDDAKVSELEEKRLSKQRSEEKDEVAEKKASVIQLTNSFEKKKYSLEENDFSEEKISSNKVRSKSVVYAFEKEIELEEKSHFVSNVKRSSRIFNNSTSCQEKIVNSDCENVTKEVVIQEGRKPEVIQQGKKQEVVQEDKKEAIQERKKEIIQERKKEIIQEGKKEITQEARRHSKTFKDVENNAKNEMHKQGCVETTPKNVSVDKTGREANIDDTEKSVRRLSQNFNLDSEETKTPVVALRRRSSIKEVDSKGSSQSELMKVFARRSKSLKAHEAEHLEEQLKKMNIQENSSSPTFESEPLDSSDCKKPENVAKVNRVNSVPNTDVIEIEPKCKDTSQRQDGTVADQEVSKCEALDSSSALCLLSEELQHQESLSSFRNNKVGESIDRPISEASVPDWKKIALQKREMRYQRQQEALKDEKKELILEASRMNRQTRVLNMVNNLERLQAT